MDPEMNMKKELREALGKLLTGVTKAIIADEMIPESKKIELRFTDLWRQIFDLLDPKGELCAYFEPRLIDDETQEKLYAIRKPLYDILAKFADDVAAYIAEHPLPEAPKWQD